MQEAEPAEESQKRGNWNFKVNHFSFKQKSGSGSLTLACFKVIRVALSGLIRCTPSVWGIDLGVFQGH